MAAETQIQKPQIPNLRIEQSVRSDINRLRAISTAMKSTKDIDYFDRNFDYVEQGEREVLLAVFDGADAGYCILNWRPKYALFRKLGVPEVQDLNILPDFRRKGIARTMILDCEAKATEKGCSHMGIGVGVDPGYGPAQILYTKLGYIPDGNGITYDRKLLAAGEFKPIDDNLCLMMLKSLK